MPKNILITGALGQLGRSLRSLAEAEHADLPKDMRLFYTDKDDLDITDEEAVEHFVRTWHIDTLVNCAAYTAVDRAEDEPELADLLNHQAAANLARVMARAGGAMLHVSTDYVFDGCAHVPYVETDAPAPRTVYGRTKLAGEEAVRQCALPAVIIRTSWLYSPYGHNFVKTMLRLGAEREEIGVVADQIGTPTSAIDLARVIVRMLCQGLIPGTYHFSDEGACSWYDFTKLILREAGLEQQCRVKPLHTWEYPARAERPHYSVLDKTKIREALGREAVPWWADSLRACLIEMGLSPTKGK